ncbi:unnamed protein product [Linum trigynum]|uniref:Uncharacterized protein n=1 Tax=Linum trigynum TaxID=586398 RepID=A0AAV2CUU3_9ROSI
MRPQDHPSPLPGKKFAPSPKDADENSLMSPPTFKHFMSPAASKVNLRKRILGERSESPVRSFKDGDENLMKNQEKGRPDAVNLKKPQFVSPMLKSTASKVNSSIAVPSSPTLLNLMKANEEIGEETDDWSPFSYDPVRNNLVPRPQFLRYRPNRLFLLEPSANEETDSEIEDEDIGSDDEVDEENSDDTEMAGSSIFRRVLQFLLVLAVLVLSTVYITSMNDNPVEIDGIPNFAAVHRHDQEIKSYSVAFVSRLEVNESWLSLDEDGTPSQLKIVKPQIPLDEGDQVKQVMDKEIAEGEEVALEEEGQEDDEEGELLSFQQPLFLPLQPAAEAATTVQVAKSLIDGTEGEEVALEEEGQEDEEEEEGELLSFQQPLFLPVQPAAEAAATTVQEAESLIDASKGRLADEMVHYREIQEPYDDGVLKNGKPPSPRLTTTEVVEDEEKYDYMELNKKLTYDFDVDNRPFQGPILAVMAVASTLVLVLLLCNLKRKGKKAAARNDSLLPSSSRDSQLPPPHSEATLPPPQDPIDEIPETTFAPLKSSGAPRVELLGEIEGGMGSRSIGGGGGTQLKLVKKAAHVQPQPAASASRNSTTNKSDRKSTSPSSRKKEVTVMGGKGKATNNSAAAVSGTTTPTTATPLRRSNRLASRGGITSP